MWVWGVCGCVGVCGVGGCGCGVYMCVCCNNTYIYIYSSTIATYFSAINY